MPSLIENGDSDGYNAGGMEAFMARELPVERHGVSESIAQRYLRVVQQDVWARESQS